jgi:hypothetical protein
MSAVDIPEETQKLMDQSKVISDYMIHLLVVNPAMLSVGSEVDKYVECFKYEVRTNIEASSDITNDEAFTDDSCFRWRAWGWRRSTMRFSVCSRRCGCGCSCTQLASAAQRSTPGGYSWEESFSPLFG